MSTISSSEGMVAYLPRIADVATAIASNPPLTALVFSMVAALIAIGYTELLYSVTKYMYERGNLLRYYPVVEEKHMFTAWSNAFSFIFPAALYHFIFPREVSFKLNPFHLIFATFAYMLMHDAWFYLVHRTLHVKKYLYNRLHKMHHEYSYGMNVYLVGYADVFENIMQVGVAWFVWTVVARGNFWYHVLPLSLTLFTTLLGHGGFRMTPWLALFHPLIIPIMLVGGKYMLTPSDHQVHHSHRRYNFGLFFRFWDKTLGTYRRCDVKPQPVSYWNAQAVKETKGQADNSCFRRPSQVSYHMVQTAMSL